MLPTNPRTKKKESSWQGESELLCLAETLILLHPLSSGLINFFMGLNNLTSLRTYAPENQRFSLHCLRAKPSACINYSHH